MPTWEARDLLEAIHNVRYFEQEQHCTNGDPNSPTWGQVISTWTHVDWVRVKPVAGSASTEVAHRNRTIIAAANTVGFTINLSATNPAEADMLAALGIAPVVTIVAHDYARRALRRRPKSRPDEWAETIAEWRNRIASLPRRTPAGRRIAICPATYTSATCKSCGACAEPRDAVIAFPAHGPAWQMVEKATAARDVPPGTSWAFLDHRTMAQVIVDEKAASV